MKTRSLGILVAASTALVVMCLQFSAAEPTASAQPGEKVPAKPVTDWKADPVCQMVFFAVLEGLYMDGVPDDVVEAIVPGEGKPGADPLARNFVPQCPICNPVYEAFALYQKRPTFVGDGKQNTFGSGGLAPEIANALKSKQLPVRVKEGISPLVKKYVSARLAKMNLSNEQKQEWQAKLHERTTQGGKLYSAFRFTPLGRELGWGFYGGCGACLGTEAACKTTLQPTAK